MMSFFRQLSILLAIAPALSGCTGEFGSQPAASSTVLDQSAQASSPTPFSIDSAQVTPTGNLVNVNLTAQTGQAVTGLLYGIAMSTDNYTFAASFGSTSWMSAMAALDIKFVRLHFEGILADKIFPTKASAADFSALAPLISNFNDVFPHATIMVTVGWMAPYFFQDGWTASDASILASQVAQLATYLKNNGINVAYWDLFNEPDIEGANGTKGTTTSPAIVQQATAAAYPALAAVSANYRFGTSPTANNLVESQYVQAAVAAYPNLSAWDGHWYGGGSDLGTAQNIAWGMVAPQAPLLAYSPLAEIKGSGFPVANGGLSYGGKSYPVILNEYGLDYNGVSADIHTIVGAIFSALLTANGTLGDYLYGAAIWDASQASFGFPVGGASAAPFLYFLSKAGQAMPGKTVVASSSGTNLLALATTSGAMVVNYSQSGSAQAGAVALAGLLNSTVHVWQLTANDPTGATTVISASALASQRFPPLSITIYYP